MKKIILFGFSLVLLAALFFALRPTGSQPAPVTSENDISAALQTVTLDISDFGGGLVTLENGEQTFATSDKPGTPNGFVSMSDAHAAIFKGDDADVYAVVNVNGGGSGTFQVLTHFEYIAATKTLNEMDAVPLGDRLLVERVDVQQTAPTAYDVLVSLKERLPGEAMAATPTQERVLHFVRNAAGLQLSDVIFGTIADPQVVIVAPTPGGSTSLPLAVAGAARGFWYFEANLPLEVRDLSGKVLGTGFATAQDDWMTEDLVPFTGAVELPEGTNGLLTFVVKKDNPSGQPELDASIEFPILVQ